MKPFQMFIFLSIIFLNAYLGTGRNLPPRTITIRSQNEQFRLRLEIFSYIPKNGKINVQCALLNAKDKILWSRKTVFDAIPLVSNIGDALTFENAIVLWDSLGHRKGSIPLSGKNERIFNDGIDGNSFHISFSPKGAKIYFVMESLSGNRLFLKAMNTEFAEEWRIPLGEKDIRGYYSKTPKEIVAYTEGLLVHSFTGSTPNICYIVKENGSLLREIRSNGRPSLRPVINHDNQTVVIYANNKMEEIRLNNGKTWKTVSGDDIFRYIYHSDADIIYLALKLALNKKISSEIVLENLERLEQLQSSSDKRVSYLARGIVATLYQ